MASEVLIVPKLSVVEYKAREGNISCEEFIRQLEAAGADGQRRIDSHNRQKENIANLAKALGDVEICDRDKFNAGVANSYKLLIAAGGDNHFTYVAKFLDKQTILGLNSDDQTSRGALLAFKPSDIDYIKECLDKGFKTESWCRLQAVLDGKLLPYYSVSEIYVGEVQNTGMNRSVITYRDKSREQKNSGIVISTGAGLTGWYANITCWMDPRFLEGLTPNFLRTDLQARFIVRENDCLDDNPLLAGDIFPGEKLLIGSLNKFGIIGFDSDPSDNRFSFEFARGCKAEITIAIGHPLTVAIRGRSNKCFSVGT